MPIKSIFKPARFTPRGLCDAYDATDKFPGACLTLSNLIFDDGNPEIMVSRPGVTDLANLGSYVSNPTAVSVHTVVGDRVYGLVGSSRNPGKDEPFSLNILTRTFDTVVGVLNSNSPTTQPFTGDWTPPTMAMVGPNLLVTHPGFGSSAIKFGWYNLTDPTNPMWTAGDLGSNGLPSVPTAVANYFNRAYFACGQQLPYSDVLSLQRSQASQQLTVGDTTVLTALSGLPLQTTSSGTIAALMAFKASQIWQVTGDAATPTTNPLSLNYLSLTIGCAAPRSIAQSPLGLYFAAYGGPYVIDPYGNVRPITKDQDNSDPDIMLAWQRSSPVTRMAADYCETVYRVCIPSTVRGVAGFFDYWFEEHRRRWNGPHTFRYDCAAQYGGFTILVSNTNQAKLIKSEVFPSGSSVYTDLGSVATSTMQTSLFPKTGAMIVKQVSESTQELASFGGATYYQLTALDELGSTINSCNVPITIANSSNIPKTYTVPWTIPLVFKKLALLLQATSSSLLSIGTHMSRYKQTGYSNLPALTAFYAADSVKFDGSTFIGRGPFSGVANGKRGLLSCWIRLDGDNSHNMNFLAGSNGATFFRFAWTTAANTFSVQCTDALGVQSLTLVSLHQYVASAAWIHVLASWDVSAGVLQLYINDVVDQDLLNSGSVDAALAYVEPTWQVGKFDAVGTGLVNGCMFDLWFDPTIYLDISQVGNRRVFISDLLKPVNLGVNGVGPTGTQPALFLHLNKGDAPFNFVNNFGNGGSFSVQAGALTTGSTSPTG